MKTQIDTHKAICRNCGHSSEFHNQEKSVIVAQAFICSDCSVCKNDIEAAYKKHFGPDKQQVDVHQKKLALEQEITRLVYDFEQDTGQTVVSGEIKCQQKVREGGVGSVMAHETRLELGIL